MFLKQAQINNVRAFAVVIDKLALIKQALDNTRVLFDIPSNSEILTAKDDLGTNKFLSSDVNLLGVNSNRHGVCFDKNLNLVAKIPDEIRIAKNDKFYDEIAAYKGPMKERQFGLYSLEWKKFRWARSDVKGLQKIDGELFSRSSPFILQRHKNGTGETYWQVDFETLYPSLKGKRGAVTLKGVFKDLVLIGLNEIDKLVALNMESGAIVWDRKTLPEFYLIDGEKNKAHIITATYKCIDVRTGNEIDSFLDREYFGGIGIYSQRKNFIIIGNHIITTDHRAGLIGAFNTVTHKFDWLHEEPNVSFPAPESIVYHAPFLCLLDSNNSLHVFEKNANSQPKNSWRQRLVMGKLDN